MAIFEIAKNGIWPKKNCEIDPGLFSISGWFEYGAIDDGIIEKLRDEEDVRVRLTGAILLLLLLKMEL